MCTLISQALVGEILGLVEEANYEDFYLRYLYDFVRYVHQCNHKQHTREYGVCIAC